MNRSRFIRQSRLNLSRQPWIHLIFLSSAVFFGTCSAKPNSIEVFERPSIRQYAGLGGIDIEVIMEGQGPSAEHGDWLKVHYILTLEDSKVVDSSHSRKPILLKLGDDSNYIEGLHRGLVEMKAGELRRIRVPPGLGYRGQKLAAIPPNVDLIFLLELMEIKSLKP